MTNFKKIATLVLVGAMLVVTMPITTNAATNTELEAQIAALLAQINLLKTQLGTTPTTPTASACFTKTLKLGMTDAEITSLQNALKGDVTVYPAGIVTGYFGSLTQAAVQKFQAKYGIATSGTPTTTGYGLVGPMTRTKLNALFCSTTPTPTTSPTTSPTTTPSVGTGLSVALAATTPAAATVIADATNGGQALIPFTTYNFTAGTDGAVTVTDLKVNRFGVSSDNDILNVYLYEGSTRIAEMKSISSNVVTFSNSAGLFTIAAGNMKTITVKADIAKGTSAGKTIGFGIASAASITAGNATTAGTFPANGNNMTVAVVTDLGTLTFTHSTAPTAVDPNLTTVRELWRLSSVAQNQKVELSSLTFTAIGTFSVGDITDFTLTIGSKTYGPVQMSSDKTVKFDLSADPFVYEAGQTKSVSLSGKVIAGASRTVYFALQNASDIVARDMNYNMYLKHGGDTFSVIKSNGTSATTINAGSLTVTRATESPTGDVAISGTNIELARFNFAAAGEKIKVSSLTGTISCSTATSTIKNVKLYVDGSQVGTTDASLVCNGSDLISGWTAFGNSFTVEAGKTAVVSVKGDLTQTSEKPSAGETVVVALTSVADNYTKTVSGDYGTTPAVSGNTLTFRSGTVTVAKNYSMHDGSATDPTFVTGQQVAPIGSFVVIGGLGEAVDINQLVVKDTAGTFPTYYSNLMLKDSAGNQIGFTYGTLTATANTVYSFVPTTAIRLNAGAQKVFNIFADIKTGLSAGNTATTTVSAVYATGVSTSQTADYTSAITLQTVYSAEKGALTITLASNTPSAQQVVSGKAYELARFQLAASNSEDVRVTNFVVSDVAGAASDVVDFTSFKLFDVTGGIHTQVGSEIYSVSTTNATPSTAGYVTFNGLSYVVPKGQNKIFAVEAKLNSWYTGQSANLHTIKLIPDYLTTASTQSSITAYGLKSNTELTQGSGLTFDVTTGTDNVDPIAANQMTVYRTKVKSITAGNFTPSSNVPSATKELAHFVIENDSNENSYELTVSNMKVTIDASNLTETGTGTRVFTLYKDGVISDGNKVARLTLAYTPGAVYGGGDLDFSTTTLTGWTGYAATLTTAFSDVKIGAGATNTFILVADTNCPEVTAANTSVVSASLGATGLTVSDGSATGITPDVLPMNIGNYNSISF